MWGDPRPTGFNLGQRHQVRGTLGLEKANVWPPDRLHLLEQRFSRLWKHWNVWLGDLKVCRRMARWQTGMVRVLRYIHVPKGNWPRTSTSLTPQYDFRPSLCIAYYILSTGCHVSSRICYPCFLSESSCKQCAYGKRGHAQTAAERFAVLAPSYDKPKQAAEDFEKSRGIEGYWRNDIILNSWNILRLLLLDEFLVVLFVHCVTIYLEMIWL